MARHSNKNTKNKLKNHKTSKSTKYWGVVDFEVGWNSAQTPKNVNRQSSSLAATKPPALSTKPAAISNSERGSKLRTVPETLEGVSHSEAALQISRSIRDTFAAHRGTIDVTSSMSNPEKTEKTSQGPTTLSGTASTSTSGVVSRSTNDKLTENGAASELAHSEVALQIAKNIRDTFAAHRGMIDVTSSMSFEENDATEKPPQEPTTPFETSPSLALVSRSVPSSGNGILTENEESSEVEDSTFAPPESPENLTPPSSSTHTSRNDLLKHIRYTLQSTSNIQMAPGSLEGVPPSEVPMKFAQEVSKNIRDTFAEHRGFIDASSSIPIQELINSDDNTSLNQSLSVNCEPMSTLESPKSIDNSMETENPPEKSKRGKKRKSEAAKAAVQGPKRKSRRLRGQEEEEEEDSEGPESTAGEIPSQDLGVIPPLGPIRTPFHFSDFAFDEPNDRLMKQLEVTMNDTVKKTRASITDPLRKNDKKDEEEYETITVAIGKEYQAELPVLMAKVQKEEDVDRDECFWKFPDQKELEEALGSYRPPTLEAMENYFKIRIQKDYWPAIWRQFKGHIPMETALQHLMKNNYSVLNALESIDKCLEELPQRFKDVCMDQAKRFIGFQKEQLRLARREKRLPENGVSHAYEATNRREIQKRVLRNYHIGEIEHFLHQFHRFYLHSEEIDGQIGCNCDDVITADREFEPRFACKNCTKHIRDTSKYPENQLCFICQKFKELSGIDRPVRDLVLDDDELRKIDFWNQFEEKLCEKITREEFEYLEKAEKLARLQAYQLTEEEIDILTIIKNGRLVPPITKSQFDAFDDQKKQEKINEICAKLEPLVLPQFISCNCKKSGGITRYSKNYGRTMFNLVEEQKFAQAIAMTKTPVNGAADLKRAGKKLKVEPEFVEVFLREYGKDDPIWKKWPKNHFHDFQPRIILPNQNMPPSIFG